MDDIRYGVYLRPDPATCWTVTQITLALRQQFGLVSAAAFPPHATLVGNLSTGASGAELVTILDRVFAEARPFVVYNHGIERTPKDTFEFNVNLDAGGKDRNEELGRVAAAVASAVAPIALPADDLLTVPVLEYEFAGHIGLASHDLVLDTRMADEVGEYLAGLPVTAPAEFTARWYTLFEFRADWATRWWEHLTWRHLTSWQVG